MLYFRDGIIMKLLLQALLLTSVSVSTTTANDDILKTPDRKPTSFDVAAPVKATKSEVYRQSPTAVRSINFDDSDSEL